MEVEQVLQDQPCVINCLLSLHPVCNESWVQNGVSSSHYLKCFVILFCCLRHSLALAQWILYQYHDHNTVSNVSLVEAYKLMYVEYPASTMYDCNVLSSHFHPGIHCVQWTAYQYADIITFIVSLSSQPVSPHFSGRWEMGWLDRLNISLHANWTSMHFCLKNEAKNWHS